MSRRSPDPSVTRRGLLAFAAAGALGLTGCGVQLEEDAPDIPFLPRRTPVPGEAMLVQLLAHTQQLGDVAAQVSEAPEGLADLHRAQVRTLRDALVHGGLPTDKSTPAAPTPTPPATREGLARAETAFPTTTPLLAAGPRSLRPALLALAAQRLATAQQLGARAPAIPAGAPESAPIKLEPLIKALSRARYLLQVVAAQSEDEQRSRAEQSLSVVEGQLTNFLAVQPDAASRLPLGYPLPSPVGDAAKAATLASIALKELVNAYGEAAGATATLGEDVAADAFGYLPPWYAACVLEAARWGTPVGAFPGLK